MCQGFSLPSDKEYHLFAVKPVIDNAYVMHHTIVYGCKAKIGKSGSQGYSKKYVTLNKLQLLFL